ncbi:MAG: LPS biosynthesis glycosyltransferase, partial [Cyanobacteria bacterium P01_E01_bin.6]
LYGPLAFTPLYAEIQTHPRLALWSARLTARLKGIARLATQRYLRSKVMFRSSSPGRLAKFALSRHLTLTL